MRNRVVRELRPPLLALHPLERAGRGRRRRPRAAVDWGLRLQERKRWASRLPRSAPARDRRASATGSVRRGAARRPNSWAAATGPQHLTPTPRGCRQRSWACAPCPSQPELPGWGLRFSFALLFNLFEKEILNLNI